jgi:hypothetical protein
MRGANRLLRLVRIGPAPAGASVSWLAHSGGVGAPPGGTMTPCQELADGGPHGTPEVDGAAPR